MKTLRKALLTLAVLSSTHSFAGREAGGGDPNADEFITNLEAVCTYFGEVSQLKSFTEACNNDVKDMKESLNKFSRTARVASTLEDVKDENGVPKVLVTTLNKVTKESAVVISRQAWNILEYDQKLVAAFMEAKLLFAIPIQRYAGEELKIFKKSPLFAKHVTEANLRKEQLYGTADKDLEVCKFVYLDKQGLQVPVIRREDGDRYLSRPGYKCKTENGHILQMVSVKQKPEGYFYARTEIPGLSYYPDQVTSRAHWIVWKDLTAKKYYTEIMSIGKNVTEMFHRGNDICNDPLTQNFRATETLPTVKWKAISSAEMSEANASGILIGILMGHNQIIRTGEVVEDNALRGNEKAYLSVRIGSPLQKMKMIRLGDKGSENGFWDDDYQISNVLCIGEDTY